MEWLFEHNDLPHKWMRWQENSVIWLAWHLPRALVYWCAVRLLAHATQDKWSDQVVPDLRALDALDRWHK